MLHSGFDGRPSVMLTALLVAMICMSSGGPKAVQVSSRTLIGKRLNAQCGCHSVTTIGCFCLMAESSDASIAGELPSTRL
jgi:hypothetical protein